MIEWISVDDRLPEKNGIYLTKYKGDKRQKIEDEIWVRSYPYNKKKGEMWNLYWIQKRKTKYSITHWAELNMPSSGGGILNESQ